MNLSRSHDWIARRLLAYGAGLLSEADTLDVEQHVRSCAECRSRLSTIRPSAGADPRHLPASLVATWPRASRLLQGAERDLVVSHLHQCEFCRASLEFAGHSPVLPAARRVVTTRRLRFGRRRTPWMWALGVLGAVAGALVWLPSLRPASERGGDASSASWFGTASAERRPAVAFETAVDSIARGSLRLPQPGYGDEADTLDVGVVTSVSGLVLVLPPALQPPTPEIGIRNMTMTMFRRGRAVATHECRFYALGDAMRLRPEGRLDAGDYELRFSLAPADPADPPIRFSYTLRVR